MTAPRSTHLRLRAAGGIVALLLLAGAASAASETPVTYVDHIKPIFEANCATCHKPGKQKGGLNLMTYRTVLKGSSSGKVVETGDPASVLMKCITHQEDPFMPPEGAKLKDDEIALIRRWIVGGLLETKDGERVEAVANAALAMSAPSVPKGAVVLPRYLSLKPFLETPRANPVTGLAASPTSPLIAAGGYQQVLLYETAHLDPVGVLPFPEGQIYDVKFSRDGALVLACGGVNGKRGSVCLWEVASGKRLFKLENDFDSTLSADVSSDRAWFATGGSDKFVKIYSAKDGSQRFNLKLHSEWITRVAFSPDAKLLATGDRNGHLHVWDVATGKKRCTLTRHQAAITGLSWRADAKLLASSANDGEVVIWDLSQGEQGTVVKALTPHPGGATDACYANDGGLVTCGRDQVVRCYDHGLSETVHWDKLDDFPLCAVEAADGTRVVSADFRGALSLWNQADHALIAKAASNPPSLAERGVEADRAIAENAERIRALAAETDEAKRKERAALTAHGERLVLEKQRWAAEAINAERYRVLDAIAECEREAARKGATVQAKGELTAKIAKLREQEKGCFSRYLEQLPEPWKVRE